MGNKHAIRKSAEIVLPQKYQLNAIRSMGRFSEDSISDDNQIVMTDGGIEEDEIPRKRDEDIRLLNLITQETRSNLIQNILGHRWMMPSKLELDRYNPSKSPGTITGHLNKLTDEGVLIRAVIPQGERSRSGPTAFFALTDRGYSLLEKHSVFIPKLDEIRYDHARVTKPDKVKQYELALRPTINVEYNHPLEGDGLEVADPVEYADDFDDFDWDNQVEEESSQLEDKKGMIDGTY